MREGEVLRRAVTRVRDEVEAFGLRLQFHYGVDEWRAFVSQYTHDDAFVSTAFDGRQNPHLDASNSAAFVVYDGQMPVAATAVRTYRWTLRHLIEHGGLWLPDHDIALGADDAGFDASALPPECPLDNPVSQRGGLYVAKPYRGIGNGKQGLGSLLSRACNALAFQFCGYDYSVALKKEAGDPFSVDCAYLGEARIGTPLIPFWLVWTSRDQARRGLTLYTAMDRSDGAEIVKFRQ